MCALKCFTGMWLLTSFLTEKVIKVERTLELSLKLDSGTASEPWQCALFRQRSDNILSTESKTPYFLCQFDYIWQKIGNSNQKMFLVYQFMQSFVFSISPKVVW